MIQQLCKVGNSTALFLDESILDTLGLTEGSHVQLTIHNGVLNVVPVNTSLSEAPTFEDTLEQVLERRKTALRRLAQ